MSSKKTTKSHPVIKTIDEKHTEMLTHFQDIEFVQIPALQEEYKELKTRLPNTKIDVRMEIKDRLQSIQTKIKALKHEKMNYYLNNSKFIFRYFEEKKKISSGDNNQNANAVNTFFKIKSTKEDDNTGNAKYNQAKIYYQKYWKNVGEDNTKMTIQKIDKCAICQKGELIPQEEDGILICNNYKCGNFVVYMVDNSNPSNKEPPNEVTYTAYVKLNHFKEILSQFQAKETTQIPDEVVEKIKSRIKKERITDIKKVTYEKMREILKTIGLNRFFEHIQYINSILGIKPPLMSEELYETLCILFIEIQRPWAIHCPPDRNNFFNYTYTLYQLCVLLDQTQYLPYIPMMKDRDKQYEQDMIWKNVCDDLDWVFCPTV
jgi:hypothetical protein